MRYLTPTGDWPEFWRLCHRYDLAEIWDEAGNLGYRYAYQQRFRRSIAALRMAAPPPASVIDVAGASGNFSLRLAELGYDVVWCDLRSEFVDYIKLKHESGKIEFLSENVFDLDFPPDQRFDAVLACEVIEHVAHPDRFLNKLTELVKPGGAIVVTTPNGQYFRNSLPRFSDCPDPSVYEAVQFRPDSDGHIFLLHLDEMRSLAAAAGLEIERLEVFSNALTAGHVKLGHLLPLLPRALVSSVERATNRLPAPFANRLHTTMLAVMRRAR